MSTTGTKNTPAPPHRARLARTDGNRDRPDRRISDKEIMLTRLGLHIPEDLTYNGWEQAGRKLSHIVDSSAWCLGDWLIYGKNKYADRYLQAIEAAELDYQTLRNYAWVAGRFELARRHEALSFQHHAEVASLPPQEQDRWLAQAEEHNWSRNELRRRIRRHRLGGTEPTAVRAPLPRLRVPTECIKRWQAAADLTMIELEQWIVATLDSAATQTLYGTADAAESPFVPGQDSVIPSSVIPSSA